MTSIPTAVFVEETGETIILNLSPSDAERASVDSSFLFQAVETYKKSQSSEDIEEANDDSNAENDGTSGNSIFIWNTPCVLLLLHLYEESISDFDGGKRHKKVYEEIAKKMKESNPRYDVTGGQCTSKINGLKRTYKKIIDHNNTSGNDRATWPYFDRMHEIFGKTGWAKPKALASEAGPFEITDSPTPETSTPKRRKINGDLKDLLEKRFKEAQEEKKVLREEKEERKGRKKGESFPNVARTQTPTT